MTQRYKGGPSSSVNGTLYGSVLAAAEDFGGSDCEGIVLVGHGIGGGLAGLATAMLEGTLKGVKRNKKMRKRRRRKKSNSGGSR